MGSFTGGVSRYLLTRFFQHYLPLSLPVGTLTVNLLGCLFIGILYGLIEKGGLMHPAWRMFLIVGFCGSFTTFSTFMNDNMLLLKNGHFITLSGYLALSLFGGFIMLYIGQLLTRIG